MMGTRALAISCAHVCVCVWGGGGGRRGAMGRMADKGHANATAHPDPPTHPNPHPPHHPSTHLHVLHHAAPRQRGGQRLEPPWHVVAPASQHHHIKVRGGEVEACRQAVGGWGVVGGWRGMGWHPARPLSPPETPHCTHPPHPTPCTSPPLSTPTRTFPSPAHPPVANEPKHWTWAEGQMEHTTSATRSSAACRAAASEALGEAYRQNSTTSEAAAGAGGSGGVQAGRGDDHG